MKSTLDYKGELSDNIRMAIVTRLESLCVGAKGLLFGAWRPIDMEALLSCPTVLELEVLADDDKAFFVGLMLAFISEFRQVNNPALDPFSDESDELRHLLVIEEAHRLLKNTAQERQKEQLGNPRGKVVEFFANVISEMRSTGQGVVVVEQIPTIILPDVIKNTNAKIVHRLVAGDDQALMASLLGLSADEALYLTSLTTGHALYMKEGMQRPVEVAVSVTAQSKRIGHDKVRRIMQADVEAVMGDVVMSELRGILGKQGDVIAVQTLCMLANEIPFGLQRTASSVREKLGRALCNSTYLLSPSLQITALFRTSRRRSKCSVAPSDLSYAMILTVSAAVSLSGITTFSPWKK